MHLVAFLKNFAPHCSITDAWGITVQYDKKPKGDFLIY